MPEPDDDQRQVARGGEVAGRALEAMMPMRKIDAEAIEAAARGLSGRRVGRRTPCDKPSYGRILLIWAHRQRSPFGMSSSTMNFRRFRQCVAVLCCIAAVFALTACGGGGTGEAIVAQGAVSASAVTIGSAGKKSSMVASSAAALPHGAETGWYWNPAEGGTGFMFEAQGNQAFVGFFLYEELTGKPIWYVAFGDMSTDADGQPVFDGILRMHVQGQPLTVSSSKVSNIATGSTPIGPVRILFQGHQATVALPGGRIMAATRFDIAGTGYDFDQPIATTREQPEVGWYWNPAEGGRGYAIEVQNNRVFMGVYHYTEDGLPTWNVIETDLSTGVGSGELKRYSDGQTLTSAYRNPQPVSIGNLTLSFRNPCSGLIQFDEIEPVGIERFRIDPRLPRGEECRAVVENRFPMANGLTAQPARFDMRESVYGYLRSPGDVHVYAVTLTGGGQVEPTSAQVELDPYSTTLKAPRLALHEADGRWAGSSSQPIRFSLLGTRTFYVSVSAANGETGSYRVRLGSFTTSQLSTPHLHWSDRGQYYSFDSPAAAQRIAGHYVGTVEGRARAELDLNVSPTGQVSGQLSYTSPPGSVAVANLAGTLKVDGRVQLSSDAAVQGSFLGYFSREGILSGSWTDAAGLRGSFVARRPPSAINTMPVAGINGPYRVIVGLAEPMSAFRSLDADGDLLTYTWELLEQPAGGIAATLTGSDRAIPIFTAHVPGNYLIGLTVHDGRGGTASTQMGIVASAAPSQLIPPPPP